GTTLAWYTGSCGGTSVGTGTPLTIAAPTSTTTYYARWETPSCAASSCASVTVTINFRPAEPTSPSTTPSTICSGASSPLTATVPVGVTVDCFTGSCGGTPVTGGTNPTVSPGSTTIYYARARDLTTGCVSATCASVTVTVNALPATPTSPTATPASICSGDS